MMVHERIRSYLQRHGLWATTRKIVEVTLTTATRALYRRHEEVLFRNDLTAPPLISSTDEFAVREATSADLPALRTFIETHHPDAEFALRRLRCNIEHGYRAAIALHAGKIAAYRWWTTESDSHPALRLHRLTLAPRELYAFDLYVAPPMRKRNLPLEFLIKTKSLLRDLGYTQAYSAVVATNRRSLWVQNLSGARAFRRHTVHVLCGRLLICRGRAMRIDDLWF